MKRLTRTILILLTLSMMLSSMTFGVSAKNQSLVTSVATVDASALRLRSQPTTASSTLAYAASGEYVIIYGKSGDWYHVSYNLTDGYMHADYLNTYSRRNVELGYGNVNANKVNVRSGPGTSYTSLTRANSGDRAYIIGYNNQWYKVIYNSHVGYIRSDYLNPTEIPYENRASKNEPLFFVDGQSTGVTPSASALNGSSGKAAQIIDNAKKLLGTPYVWGGTSPKGFDCSGFVQYVFNQSGIQLPRTTTEQYTVGTYVPKSSLQPGDLVFLQNTYRQGISHVGIYVGDGKMIHASSSKGVVISSLSTSYYTQHYYGARRVL